MKPMTNEILCRALRSDAEQMDEWQGAAERILLAVERIEGQAKELKRFHDLTTGLAKFEAAQEERL